MTFCNVRHVQTSFWNVHSVMATGCRGKAICKNCPPYVRTLLQHLNVCIILYNCRTVTNIDCMECTRGCYDSLMSRFDSVRSRSDRFDPIHYPFVQTNTAKNFNSEFHLNDLLNKITMNKEHKIHHNTSDSQ